MSKQQSSMESSASSIPIQSLYSDTKFILHIPEEAQQYQHCRECKLPLTPTPRLTVVGLTYKYTVSTSLRQELHDNGTIHHFTYGMPDFDSMGWATIARMGWTHDFTYSRLRSNYLPPLYECVRDTPKKKSVTFKTLATRRYEALMPTLDLGYRYTEESPTEFSWSIEGAARIRYRLSNWGRAVGYSDREIENIMHTPAQGWNQSFYRDFFLRRSLGDPPRTGGKPQGAMGCAPRGGFGQWDFPDRAVIGDTSFAGFPNIPGAGKTVILYPEVPADTHHLNLEVHITLGRPALNDSFSSMTLPQLKRLISKRILGDDVDSLSRNWREHYHRVVSRNGIMDLLMREVVGIPLSPKPGSLVSLRGKCNGLHRIKKIRGPTPGFNGRKVVSRSRRRAFYRTIGAHFNEENYP